MRIQYYIYLLSGSKNCKNLKHFYTKIRKLSSNIGRKYLLYNTVFLKSNTVQFLRYFWGIIQYYFVGSGSVWIDLSILNLNSSSICLSTVHFYPSCQKQTEKKLHLRAGFLLFAIDMASSEPFPQHTHTFYTLLDRFWRISLYVTDDAIAKLYGT